ncbi:endopeptidase La [Ectothiorhodospiraceae bacterium BW-2]|nr:endopeptidase La [Ectothiorhodospiraceae bacterium BW-2]
MSDETEQELLDAEVLSQEELSNAITVSEARYPEELHLLPLFERPFFPAQASPLLMEEQPWLSTIEAIGETEHRSAGLLLVKEELDNETLPSPEQMAEVGTLVRLHRPSRSDGKMQFIAEGITRFKIVKWLNDTPPYRVRVEYPPKEQKPSDEVRAYAMAIINTLKELMHLNPLYSEEMKFFLNRFGPNEPSPLSDFAATLTSASADELQQVLDRFDLDKRMQKVLVLLKKELELAKIQSRIRERVEENMNAHQRRFFLKEQLKEIQKELGLEKDDRTAEIEKFQQRLERLTLSEEAQKVVEEELDKLAMLESGSAEFNVTRNYLDWITSLPWGNVSQDRLDLKRAVRVLNREHDGLEDVKDRILEFLAVGKLKGSISGSIILLIGPPGVGKTSVGRSIANTLGRKFYRFSVGGMRDEAEIKGHRRTYIGALPGKIVHALKQCGTDNPVIMLDEIDKIGASYHGDPASALLEVLDPEQNSEFQDHYLDIRLDLSKVLFVCTANQLDTIPGPLLDRMEVIRLSGYITEEKLAIAKHHLWPRQLERNGLTRQEIKITPTAIRKIIEGYAREAGVRNLEKQLGRIIRKAAREIVEESETPIKIADKNLTHYLGKPTFTKESPIKGIGVVTGLAWTAMGGATLSIEASQVHTKNRGFKLTGKLGEVMRESAEIAYSYIAANLNTYRADEKFFNEAFVHLHVPEGATPKDGPSAGITMATALLSLAKGDKIARKLAMTGELTLTGQVLPVGGIREKVIAARRIGIVELIFPEANRGDFEELPDYIRDGITAHFAKHYREVAAIVFEQ